MGSHHVAVAKGRCFTTISKMRWYLTTSHARPEVERHSVLVRPQKAIVTLPLSNILCRKGARRWGGAPAAKNIHEKDPKKAPGGPGTCGGLSPMLPRAWFPTRYDTSLRSPRRDTSRDSEKPCSEIITVFPPSRAGPGATSKNCEPSTRQSSIEKRSQYSQNCPFRAWQLISENSEDAYR